MTGSELGGVVATLGSLLLVYPFLVEIRAKIRRRKELRRYADDPPEMRRVIRNNLTEELLRASPSVSIAGGIGALMLAAGFLLLIYG